MVERGKMQLFHFTKFIYTVLDTIYVKMGFLGHKGRAYHYTIHLFIVFPIKKYKNIFCSKFQKFLNSILVKPLYFFSF